MVLRFFSDGFPIVTFISKIASNRLQKELAEWQLNPPTGFKHTVTDNLQRWIIEVNGAPGTLYANEIYQLQVDFPEHYPMEAPQVIFLSPAPIHPHIYSSGHICLGSLGISNTKILSSKLNYRSSLSLTSYPHAIQAGSRPKSWRHSGLKMSQTPHKELIICRSQASLTTESFFQPRDLQQ